MVLTTKGVEAAGGITGSSWEYTERKYDIDGLYTLVDKAKDLLQVMSLHTQIPPLQAPVPVSEHQHYISDLKISE